MPELDDLKAAWENLNRNLERQHTLALHQFKESKLARFRSGLGLLAIGQVIQMICGAGLIALSARFWAGHLGVYHLMAWGIFLHGYGIMLAWFAARDLIAIYQIDYAAPVVTIQTQLATLRASHLRAGLWLAIAGCFVWMPLLLVVLYALGADVWAAKPQIVWWFVLNGVVCLGLAAVVAYFWRRPQQKFGRYLRESAVGRSVERAQATLNEIAAFRAT